MRGKVEYWRYRFLLPYEYLHDPHGCHYPPEPAILLGRCNIKQFMAAVELLGVFIGVRHEDNLREQMYIIDRFSREYPEQYYLDFLYGCSVGTVFGFLDPFDELPIGQHISENIYGTVTHTTF